MKIRWTDPAIAGLKAIEDHISLDSEYYAKTFIEKILYRVDKLKDFPSVGIVVPEYEQEDIREIILNIVHTSRDFLKAMKENTD
ncbi:MAG: type II toxin-antitoxin system RelE/ParE family toxin [Candidatus Marinimicrobia bacterium]|nr:type II toxin-antitoxin system RelE/ParE family toxin [Candidatus Neomarinimicrobiota bacterium]